MWTIAKIAYSWRFRSLSGLDREFKPCDLQSILALNLWFSTLPCLLSITAKATYAAIAKTYAYLTPDLWKETVFTKSPYQEFTDYLAKNHRPITGQRQEVKQY